MRNKKRTDTRRYQLAAWNQPKHEISLRFSWNAKSADQKGDSLSKTNVMYINLPVRLVYIFKVGFLFIPKKTIKYRDYLNKAFFYSFILKFLKDSVINITKKYVNWCSVSRFIKINSSKWKITNSYMSIIYKIWTNLYSSDIMLLN